MSVVEAWRRERWWLMRVDAERRVYVFVTDLRRYWDASFTVDVAVATEHPDDFVVWDSEEQRVIHDSREVKKKPRQGTNPAGAPSTPSAATPDARRRADA